MSEEGLDKLTLTMHYSDTELMAQMSEFLQQSWPKAVWRRPVELKLQAMPANQLSQVKRDGRPTRLLRVKLGRLGRQ